MYNNKSIFAFIPAKTNSTGLANKMFKTIGEFNLFEWTLLASLKSKYIDEVVVSSQDDNIEKNILDFKNFAIKNLGVENKNVIFVRRSTELCSPNCKTEEVMSNFFLERFSYRSFDFIVTLQATSPARRNNLIDQCIQKCIDSYDSLLTVEKHTPFFWRKNSETNTNYPTYSLRSRPMRQEINDDDFYYKDNGNIYISSVASYLNTKLRVSGKVCLHETDKFESMQIDTAEDFVIMSKLFEYYGSLV